MEGNLTSAEIQNAKAYSLLTKGAAEFARLIGLMIALITAAWFLAGPAAHQFVVEVVDDLRLAPLSDVESLKSSTKEIQKEQYEISKEIEHQGAQIDNIEKLAAEQRSLSNQILFELKKP